jgi:DNA-binding transcriptional regulator YiaG
MTKIKKTRLQRLETALKSVEDWHAGKAKLRTWEMDASGNRRMFYQSHDEYQLEKERGKALKLIREELGLSQGIFAKVIRTSARTLQGWEAGKNVPTPVLVLVELLRDSEDVRKRLMTGVVG